MCPTLAKLNNKVELEYRETKFKTSHTFNAQQKSTPAYLSLYLLIKSDFLLNNLRNE